MIRNDSLSWYNNCEIIKCHHSVTSFMVDDVLFEIQNSRLAVANWNYFSQFQGQKIQLSRFLLDFGSTDITCHPKRSINHTFKTHVKYKAFNKNENSRIICLPIFQYIITENEKNASHLDKLFVFVFFFVSLNAYRICDIRSYVPIRRFTVVEGIAMRWWYALLPRRSPRPGMAPPLGNTAYNYIHRKHELCMAVLVLVLVLVLVPALVYPTTTAPYISCRRVG